MMLAFVAAQAAVAVPVTPAAPLAPVTSGYSIVVARAVSQTDPLPIACGSDHCTSWFLGTFDRARTAGAPLSPEFQARIEMGSPFHDRYTLALLVEAQADGTRRVRATQGFHYQTRLACFEPRETQALSPPPVGDGLIVSGRALCVKQPSAE